MLMRTGDYCPSSQRERQCVIYHQLGDRESFTATAGEAVPQTAACAGKWVGYAAPVATGIVSNAKIHKTLSDDV
jgi:hypothetical protein